MSERRPESWQFSANISLCVCVCVCSCERERERERERLTCHCELISQRKRQSLGEDHRAPAVAVPSADSDMHMSVDREFVCGCV